MARIKVTGYLDADDYELDSGPLGPLTNASYEELMGIQTERTSPRIMDLDEVEFELEAE